MFGGTNHRMKIILRWRFGIFYIYPFHTRAISECKSPFVFLEKEAADTCKGAGLLRITLFEFSFTTLRVFSLFRSLHCLC
jgi:hypothetical protein